MAEEKDLGRGQKVVGFSSSEDMFAYLAEQRRANHEALQWLLPSQQGITWGSYVIRIVPGDPDDLVIYGRILPQEEIEDPQEVEDITVAMDEQGLVYGKWFSEVVPEGEYGSAHRISCWPIRDLDFQLAGAAGWQLWDALHHRISDEIEKEREAGE